MAVPPHDGLEDGGEGCDPDARTDENSVLRPVDIAGWRAEGSVKKYLQRSDLALFLTDLLLLSEWRPSPLFSPEGRGEGPAPALVILRLKLPVERVGPLAQAPDVQSQVARQLRGAADGEGMPLSRCDGRDLDEDPVARFEVEAWRSLHHQLGDLGGQQLRLGDDSPTMATHVGECSVGDLNQPDKSHGKDPSPEVFGVAEETEEVSPVEHVGVVECSEVASPSDARQGEDEDDGEDEEEQDSSRVGLPSQLTKHSRLLSEKPVSVGPGLSLARTGLAEEAAVVVDDVRIDSLRNVEGSFRTELSQDIVTVDDRAARWRFVPLEYLALAITLGPVPVGQLDELDGVRLDVDGEVGEVHHGVEEALQEDQDPHQFVEVNVVVEWQDGGQANPPEDGDGVPQDESEHQHGVEHDDSATGSGHQVEGVGCETTEGAEVSEVVSSLYEEESVDHQNDEDAEAKVVVVAPVLGTQIFPSPL